MAKVYKIGDKVIDLEKLLCVGDVNRWRFDYTMTIPLIFEFNSNVEVTYRFLEDDIEDDLFKQIEIEREKLIKEWSLQKPVK